MDLSVTEQLYKCLGFHYTHPAMRVGKAGLNTRGRKKTKSAACLCELAADRSGNRCRGEVRLDIEVLHFHTVYRGLCSANGVDQINIIDGELL